MPSHDLTKSSVPGQFRRSNGRIVKKKTVDKEMKCIEAMSKAKKKYMKDKKIYKNKGQRVVDLCELGKNPRCSWCKRVLDVENKVAERKCGLDSILSTVCIECNITSAVHTGKIRNSDDGQLYAF